MPTTLEAEISEPRTPLEHEIAELGPWFHNIHLPDGTQTAPGHPLGDFPTYKWRLISPDLPEDMTDWTVLDIGCNAGFYSLQLAARGADVTAIDIDDHYLDQARWAAGQFGMGSRIQFLRKQVYELAFMEESYDLILFMGVFYHLRHPLLALDIVSEKFEKLLVFQTLTMPGEQVFVFDDSLTIDDRLLLLHPGWPKMAFIEKSLAGDPTNWWAPNHAAVLAMLRSCGLRVLKNPGHEIYICRRDAPRNTDVNREEISIATKSLAQLNSVPMETE